MLKNLRKELYSYRDEKQAEHDRLFFKTQKGEYGEGDKFLGVSVPLIRELSKKYKNLKIDEIQELLNSKWHEERTLSLFILINKYNKTINKKEIVDFYLKNTKNINNWDLVDMSCYKILGHYLYEFNNKNYDILLKLSTSKNLWERRISIVSTMYFIKNIFFNPTIEISKILLKNEHQLINKAVGWMLREIGKRNFEILNNFLLKNIKDISSLTFSYATEKFNEEDKKRLKLLRSSK